MKEFDSVIRFSEDSSELYTAFKEFSAHHIAEKKNKTTVNFSQHSLSDKSKVINELYREELFRRSGVSLDQVKGDMKKYGQKNAVRECSDEMNEYLIDMILPERLQTSGLAQIAEFHYEGFNDTMTFKIKSNALPTVNEIGARQKHTLTQKKNHTTGTINLKNYAVTVISNLPAVLTDRESVAELIMDAILAIEAKIYMLIYAEFVREMKALINPFQMQNWDEKEALKVIRAVKLANGGKEVILMGSDIALKSVLPDSQLTRIPITDDYNTTLGYMGVFNGYKVVLMETIPDYDNLYDYKGLLDDNEIYIICPSAGALIQVGVGDFLDSNTDSDYDNMNLAILGTNRKSIGVKCITNSFAGIIRLGVASVTNNAKLTKPIIVPKL